ncbi:hypothetical protein LSCM1_07501 [Leishmania martiniquensis]|uniref:Uncharacterized protein n=1 Tax=Leishmania martiniquensis TaxID=1580590 RepID=A0A836H817_9TRYP|nr:hypothetical protein LSCM1_07501 [Leishmania martiniquensis]
MSRATPQAADVPLQHFIKTERVVRLECERREAKARLKLVDAMSDDLNDQLLCVAQFKKEWLQSRRLLEEARQAIVQEEASTRAYVEEEHVKAINKVVRHYHPLGARAG